MVFLEIPNVLKGTVFIEKVTYLVRTFHKSLKLFNDKMKLYITTTNSISNVGFNFKAKVYLEDSLKPVNNYKNLVADNLRPIGRYFG